MPLRANAVGTSLGSLDLIYDRRWAMAYAAGIPDERPALFDGTTLTVHPVFPVTVEWSLITSRLADTGLSADEARRGVHIRHDLRLHRPLPPSAALHLDAQLVAVDRRRTGATQTVLFTATGDDGSALWSTAMTSLLLGVELDGAPTSIDHPWSTETPAAPPGRVVASARSHVRRIDAHVYAECARIWNPIHTDATAAARAGLAEPILHGTATLARGVSIATDLVGIPLDSVDRVAGAFVAPVRLDTMLEVRVLATDERRLWFEVLTADDAPAVRGGCIEFTRSG